MPVEGGPGYHPPNHWGVILGHRIGFSIESRVILTIQKLISPWRIQVLEKQTLFLESNVIWDYYFRLSSEPLLEEPVHTGQVILVVLPPLMETFSLNSLYIAVFVLAVFILIVLYICLKLVSQDSRIDHLLQPEAQVIPPRRPAALERAHRPVKLRKPKNHRNVTRGSQTVNVKLLHAAFKKSTISTQNPLSEESEDEIRVESVQLFSSPDFYQDPSVGYESVRDIVRPSATYSHIHR